MESPAAIGCPPNLLSKSLHFSISSNILYSSMDLPEPFGISFPWVKIKVGLPYLSLTLPATIPAILSWICWLYTTSTLSFIKEDPSMSAQTCSTLSVVRSCLSLLRLKTFVAISIA